MALVVRRPSNTPRPQPWSYLVTEIERLSGENGSLKRELEEAKARIKEQDNLLHVANDHLTEYSETIDSQLARISELEGEKESGSFGGGNSNGRVKVLLKMVEVEKRLKNEALEKQEDLKEFVKDFCRVLTALLKDAQLDTEDQVDGGDQTEGNCPDLVEGQLGKIYELVEHKIEQWRRSQDGLKNELAEMTQEVVNLSLNQGHRSSADGGGSTVTATQEETVSGIKEETEVVDLLDSDSEEEFEGMPNLRIVGTQSLTPEAPATREEDGARLVDKIIKTELNEEPELDFEMTTQSEDQPSETATPNSSHEQHPTNPLACVCGYETNKIHNLRIHIKYQVQGKIFGCEKCPQRFFRYSELRRHYGGVHKDKAMCHAMKYGAGCSKCGLIFQSMLAFQTHFLAKHGDATPGNKQVINATRKHFLARLARNNPFGGLGTEDVAVDQAQDPSRLPGVNRGKVGGVSKKKKHFRCDQCTSSFSALSVLRLHQRKVHEMAPPGFEIGCRDCGKIFRDRSSHCRHKIKVHKSTIGNNLRRNLTPGVSSSKEGATGDSKAASNSPDNRSTVHHEIDDTRTSEGYFCQCGQKCYSKRALAVHVKGQMEQHKCKLGCN